MLPVLVIPRQSSVKYKQRKALQCMHHKWGGSIGQVDNHVDSMDRTAERDDDSDESIPENSAKFRAAKELDGLCISTRAAPADSASRHEADSGVGRLAWTHVQTSCP
jgi:hypothetical protein